MRSLEGKKILTFLALPYHNRILVPVMKLLEEQGAKVTYFTAAAEAAFEITFNEIGLPYRHAQDFLPRVKDQIDRGWADARNEWQRRLLDSHWALQTVPLTIQDKITRSMIENLNCFRALVEEEKPDLCFALHELNSWGKILGYLCHERDIPYITFQEGLCYGHPFLYQMHVEYSTTCVCWGDTDAQVLIDAGGDPKRISKLGSVDLWPAIERTTQPTAIAEAKKKLGVEPQMQVVLFLMSHANYNVFEPDPLLRWMINRGNTAIVFKWHPALARDVIKAATPKLQGIPYVFSLQDYDTYDLLGMSDVCVIVGESTTGVEALAYGKPLIAVKLPHNLYTYESFGVAEPANGFEDIPQKIEELLANGVPPARQQKVEEYLARHFTYRDNKTAHRVATLAEEILLEREANMKGVKKKGLTIMLIITPKKGSGKASMKAKQNGKIK